MEFTPMNIGGRDDGFAVILNFYSMPKNQAPINLENLEKEILKKAQCREKKKKPKMKVSGKKVLELKKIISKRQKTSNR